MRRFIRNPRYREPDDAGTQEADGQEDGQQDEQASQDDDEEGGQEEGGG
jgi:hypothetical protein